ncbi:MAG TPA: hypothetical protein VFZ61_12205 [Polyangiales bacterium]
MEAGVSATPDSGSGGATPGGSTPGAAGGAAPGGAAGGSMPGAGMGGGTPGAGMTGGSSTPGMAGGQAGGATPDAGTPTTGGMGGMPPTTGGGQGTPPTPHTGPLDGDPSKPMVSVPGLTCGNLQAGFGRTPQSVKITNRDVVVGYPCAHEGAAVTFLIFLHGTLGEAQKVPFTMSAFPVHRHIDSHNFIVVVPKSVVDQWGNGDNGVDMPHLKEVVDWVYTTFGQKFNIRSMWASGGSWGAAYLGNTFACEPAFEQRLKGVRMIVGGGCPRCTQRLSCIVAQQELDRPQGMAGLTDAEEDMRGSMYLNNWAMMHGCDAKKGPVMLAEGVKQWNWANCDPGFVHSYYLAPGQHADSWDYGMGMDSVVLKMLDEMKSAEK